jgi:pimeloyl-ACP methyl ester carboxylesterase
VNPARRPHPDPAAAPPFRVTDEAERDLRARLRSTRWPERWPLTGWAAGTEQGELRRLAAYWADGFDWRAQEAAINALPRYVAEIDGLSVHYLRFDGEGADSLPLVATHGWPSTFLELVGLAQRLSAPSRCGVADAPSFTVIVPSLPGFAFTPQQARVPGMPTHELWHRLMLCLGFDRYAAHGGDLGAGVTTRLAEAYPDAVRAIHLLAVRDPVGVTDPTAEERAYLAEVERWIAEEGGYEHLQQTRPLTAAYGLNDSPVGSLSWLLEKYRAWTDRRDGRTGLSDDYVLTQASLYWFTGTIASSFRPYWEHRAFPPANGGRIPVPTALAVFPGDLVHPPRSWAERAYELRRYTRMPRGGHFAAVEEPDLLADDIRAFLTSLT